MIVQNNINIDTNVTLDIDELILDSNQWNALLTRRVSGMIRRIFEGLKTSLMYTTKLRNRCCGGIQGMDI